MQKPDILSTQGIMEPTAFDILLGHSAYSLQHVGNQCFRLLIVNNAARYASVYKKHEKMAIVSSIRDTIRNGGGRFLKQHPDNHQWYRVKDSLSRQKISHALRDRLAHKKIHRRTKSQDIDPKALSDSGDSFMSDPSPFVDWSFDPQNGPRDLWCSMVLEILHQNSDSPRSAASYVPTSAEQHGGLGMSKSISELGSSVNLKPALNDVNRVENSHSNRRSALVGASAIRSPGLNIAASLQPDPSTTLQDWGLNHLALGIHSNNSLPHRINNNEYLPRSHLEPNKSLWGNATLAPPLALRSRSYGRSTLAKASSLAPSKPLNEMSHPLPLDTEMSDDVPECIGQSIFAQQLQEDAILNELVTNQEKIAAGEPVTDDILNKLGVNQNETDGVKTNLGEPEMNILNELMANQDETDAVETNLGEPEKYTDHQLDSMIATLFDK